jgi:hypothetical protein
MIRRHEFIARLGGAVALAGPARAQRTAVPIVGWLHPRVAPSGAAYHLGLPIGIDSNRLC